MTNVYMGGLVAYVNGQATITVDATLSEEAISEISGYAAIFNDIL